MLFPSTSISAGVAFASGGLEFGTRPLFYKLKNQSMWLAQTSRDYLLFLHTWFIMFATGVNQVEVGEQAAGVCSSERVCKCGMQVVHRVRLIRGVLDWNRSN